MTDSQEHMNDWEACPPGTLKALATNLSGRRRRAVAGRIGVALACMLVLLASGKAVLQPGRFRRFFPHLRWNRMSPCDRKTRCMGEKQTR